MINLQSKFRKGKEVTVRAYPVAPTDVEAAGPNATSVLTVLCGECCLKMSVRGPERYVVTDRDGPDEVAAAPFTLILVTGVFVGVWMTFAR